MLTWVAHSITIDNYNRAGSSREYLKVNSTSVGGVSTGFTDTNDKVTDSYNYKATTFGSQYLQYVNLARPLNIFI